MIIGCRTGVLEAGGAWAVELEVMQRCVNQLDNSRTMLGAWLLKLHTL